MENFDCVLCSTISTRKPITGPLFYITPKAQAMNLKILERQLEEEEKICLYRSDWGYNTDQSKFDGGVFI
jgi:hypothetical protein